MTTENDPPGEQHEPKRERKPYEKPRILWDEVLEVRKTLAVACGKTSGQGGICNAVPTS